MSDVWHDFFFDVSRVAGLSPRLERHREIAIHPCVPIDAVDRKEPETTGHQQRLDRFDEEETLVLEEVSRRRRIEQDRRSGVSVRDDRHVVSDRLRVPAVTLPRKARIDELHGRVGA